MSHQSKTIAQVDPSVESALADIRSQAPSCRDRVRRGWTGSCFTGWLASALLHLAILLAVSIALMPRDMGRPAVLTVEWSPQIAQMPLEPSPASDEGTFELATTTSAPENPFDPRDAAAELSFSPLAGAPGGRSAGWRSGATKGTGAPGRSGPRASFYGTVAYGNRFVYVLDKSGSMRFGKASDSRGKKGRFERAREELLRSIDELGDDEWFYVILFSHVTRRMFDDTSTLPEMVPATAENKAKLRAWLDTVTIDGDTDPRQAIRLGLAMKPSALFLLSDGEFNWKNHPERDTVFDGNVELADIIERANDADAPIHTFAFEDPAGRNQLIAVASQTGGEHRDIVPPAMSEEQFAKLMEANAEQRKQRAESLLQLAKTLETGGRKEEATRRYRSIVSEFPDTPAAQNAVELLARKP